ncbi:hypothetical protein V8C44DRAFT_343780 [Trichoderma aethiopicum]
MQKALPCISPFSPYMILHTIPYLSPTAPFQPIASLLQFAHTRPITKVAKKQQVQNRPIRNQPAEEEDPDVGRDKEEIPFRVCFFFFAFPMWSENKTCRLSPRDRPSKSPEPEKDSCTHPSTLILSSSHRKSHNHPSPAQSSPASSIHTYPIRTSHKVNLRRPQRERETAGFIHSTRHAAWPCKAAGEVLRPKSTTLPRWRF